MKTDTLMERQYAANLLALQGTLRVGGLIGIGMISTVRKALDTYLVCLERGAEYVKSARMDDPPQKWVGVCADTMNECVERSWQDYRNNVQIMLLTQDEATHWVNRIDRMLLDA